jgi:hypothetical protein
MRWGIAPAGSCRTSGVFSVTLLLLAALGPAATAEGASLRGSRASVNRQVRVAHQHDFSFLRTPAEVRKFVDLGLLVTLPGNAHYTVDGEASFPVARPEMKLFIERLSRQYHAATGEKLVVTSLTRPLSNQPRNASQNSVHPTGMAADIHRSYNRRARKWLEKTLLTLEQRGVLEATLERHPWHYHVAVFPRQYAAYVDRKLETKDSPSIASTASTASTASAAPATPAPVPAPSRTTAAADISYATYRVQSGDTLWTIAQTHQTSVARLKKINAIRSPRIYPGQKIMVPVR